MKSFEKEFYLRTSDFDCRMGLLPSAVLDFFQDVAGEHARALGIGREKMAEEHLAWVIVKARYRVLSTPAQFDRIRVSTWPLSPRRSIFQRDYKITDMEGNPLVLGSSEWVVIHTDRRRLVSVGDVYPLTEFLDEHNFPEGFSRLRDFDGEGGPQVIYPQFTDIDTNGHVNNIKYANYIMNALAPDEGERIRDFEIEYHREVMADAPLALSILREAGAASVKGSGEDGARMFTARLTWM
jgi:acyl-ACP thioesterase